jgi:chloramphenicol 3-O-phosphotransferase
MNSITVYLAFALAALLAWLPFRQKKTHLTGTVIILNGPSVSGKSSIQKEFQKLMMPNAWFKLGLDNLFDNPMPEITTENISFWQHKNAIRWIETTKDATGNPVVTLFVGPEGEKVALAMNSAIAAYAANGCNVIVDYISYEPAWLSDLEKKLKDFKTYYVAVQIPLEVLEQREATRSTSPKGHARSHYAMVYGTKKYDLTVHTDTMSATEIAQELKKMISKS